MFARARKLVNSVEFQLQQLEQDAAIAHSVINAKATGASEDEAAVKRAAVAENLNRLASETALLERLVNDTSTGGNLPPQKRDLWRK